MANDTKSNPWILDTVGVIATGIVRVRHIEFAGYALDTDKCIIKDGLGRSAVLLDGASDLETVRTGNVGWLQGLTLDTLTDGVVRVFVE